MFQSFRRQRHVWEDAAAFALALGYLGSFVAAIEFALARLVFLSAF
ncbi:MAG: hypothetical protein ACOYOH_01355 [Paracraurococcus sp.]